ncbi:hypothetical protein TVAG_153310 [Trichomonas vaginalis G3]|uniref:Uncharacterized protein n=1 Tax=Trichomonas vaginalis (strain ATCC PRA-98 / G3) TaxID=412133 RepID=A2FYY5_TRIV3|nr:hypothetical protein TVAGG3_0521190 [Trichomonas vaginalis G3]EAX89886.1 hypothetical protein TVAG_153310 [Trichomonas vaginalis G3]KAI5518462.1 hypothetical protein TVAGG3_0521190 [Trichomonas vaginalis G3]|eukprot:XP_001302816.1 hypothetical protein [Trichomonas vaginalis G3]
MYLNQEFIGNAFKKPVSNDLFLNLTNYSTSRHLNPTHHSKISEIVANHSIIQSKNPEFRYFNSIVNTDKHLNREHFYFELTRLLNVDPDFQRHEKNILLIGSHTSVGNSIKTLLKEQNILFAELKSIHEIQFTNETLQLILDRINIEGIIFCYDPLTTKSTRVNDFLNDIDKKRILPIIEYIKQKKLKTLFVSPMNYNFDLDLQINASVIYYPSIIDSKTSTDTSNVLYQAKINDKYTNYCNFDGKISSVTADEVAKYSLKKYFDFKPGSVIIKPNSEISIENALKEINISINENFNCQTLEDKHMFDGIDKISIENNSVSDVIHKEFDNFKKINSNKKYISFISVAPLSNISKFQDNLEAFDHLASLYQNLDFEIIYVGHTGISNGMNFTIPERLKNKVKMITIEENDCDKLFNITNKKISTHAISMYHIGIRNSLGKFILLFDDVFSMNEHIFELLSRKALNKYVLYSLSATEITGIEKKPKYIFQFFRKLLKQEPLFDLTADSIHITDVISAKTAFLKQPKFSYLLSRELFDAIGGFDLHHYAQNFHELILGKFLQIIPGYLISKWAQPLIAISSIPKVRSVDYFNPEYIISFNSKYEMFSGESESKKEVLEIIRKYDNYHTDEE